MRYCVQSDEETVLFGAERGCAAFEQRLLRFDGPSASRSEPDDDEVIYVLRGAGRASIAGRPTELTPGTAAYVAAGTAWSVDRADGLELLSVLVRDPVPADGTTHAVVAIGDTQIGNATAGRLFHLLATPEVGCRSVTQFVGVIPVGRAPDHFHTYDEVVYVLQGVGALHVADETARLRPGSCVHLPARLVHALENAGPGEMRVLGVFRPAGSPAEAYYPDGTPAAY